MSFVGIIMGAATFLCIGMFHPIVIKAEYHFGTRCWWAFLLAGIGCTVASLLILGMVLSTLFRVAAFSCCLSILELVQQRKPVEKGWLPKNPK